MDPKLKPVVALVLETVVPPNNGFDAVPKENPEDCVVVVLAEDVVVPKENNGFVVPVVLVAAVVFVVADDDPKLNPVPVPFEAPNIFCKFHPFTTFVNKFLQIISLDKKKKNKG